MTTPEVNAERPTEFTDLDTIEARCEAATPGPWRFAPGDRVYGRAFDEDEALLSVCADDAREVPVAVVMEHVDDGSDAEFIAHARTDVPALVAILRHLREMALTTDDHQSVTETVLRLTGGDYVPDDDVEDPPTAWINEWLVGEMGAPR